MNEEHGDQMPPPNVATPPEMTAPVTPSDVTAHAQPQPAQQVSRPEGTPPLTNTYTSPSYAPSPVVPNQSPQKKSRGLLIGAGVAVVALLVALGGVLAVRGNSNVGASTFSLQSAATSASNAQTVAFDMAMNVGGQDVKVTGQVDSASQTMSMNMDLMGQGEMDMILDAESQTMYMSGDVFAAMSTTKWMSVDLSVVPGLEKQLAGGFGDNPLQVTGLFDGSQQVTEVGKETINGVETMHYEVAMNTADIMAEMPDAFGQLDAQAKEMLPDEIIYQFYVTEDNELARLSFDMDTAGVPMSVVVDVKGIDDAAPITIPPASDVTDMTDQMAGAMGGAMDSATG